MRLGPPRRAGSRQRVAPDGAVGGPARLGRRTKELTRRLRPGDVAIIDHRDLDRVSAEALLESGVTAVVNAAHSCTGRYPNAGPAILLAGGVAVLDGVGDEVFTRVREGEAVLLDGPRLVRGGVVVADGQPLTAELLAERALDAQANVTGALAAFTANTLDYLAREQTLLFEPVSVPELRTPLAGRQALVVVRGYDYRADLAILRPYIRDYRPVLIAVDGGADALLEAGYRPDVIVGDMDSVSDAALRCGAQLLVHAYADGHAPGLARVQKLGLSATALSAAGTSEDAALLLADAAGATLIVAVGTHASLEEFLDKGREGMASTFLTRLRVGSKLVDAKGVSRLYRSRISGWLLGALILATVLTFASALAVSEAGRTYVLLVAGRWHDLLHWLRH